MTNGFAIDLTGVEYRQWQSVPGEEIFPGIVKRTIWQGGNGARALVLEFAPGASFLQADKHDPGPEEVFVVSGTFNDGVRDYPAGTFIHCPAGSLHVPQSPNGCVLFVFYPEG